MFLTRFIKNKNFLQIKKNSWKIQNSNKKFIIQNINNKFYQNTLILNRNFTIANNDETHPDFQTIRHKYEGKHKEEIQKMIKNEIESHPVVIFMKGTPSAPQCGFSALACRILQEEGVKNLRAINVLEDINIREGIKEYTKWPTIPQIFINKEFIGGSDIIKSLFETGELTEILKKAGVKTIS